MYTQENIHVGDEVQATGWGNRLWRVEYYNVHDRICIIRDTGTNFQDITDISKVWKKVA